MALPRPQTMATKRRLKNEVAAVIAVDVVNKTSKQSLRPSTARPRIVMQTPTTSTPKNQLTNPQAFGVGSAECAERLITLQSQTHFPSFPGLRPALLGARTIQQNMCPCFPDADEDGDADTDADAEKTRGFT